MGIEGAGELRRAGGLMPLILHPVSRSSRELRTALYPIGRARVAARASAGQVTRAFDEASYMPGATIAVTGGEPAVRAGGSSIRSLRTKVMTQINFWTRGRSTGERSVPQVRHPSARRLVQPDAPAA